MDNNVMQDNWEFIQKESELTDKELLDNIHTLIHMHAVGRYDKQDFVEVLDIRNELQELLEELNSRNILGGDIINDYITEILMDINVNLERLEPR